MQIEGIQRMFRILIGFSDAAKAIPIETSETAVKAITSPVKSIIEVL